MNSTPKANRLHIALFGKRNSGKSSLINALTGQDTALVSGIPGTTTDSVYQAMEISGIGPCVFIDTAGFDDEGELGALRIGQTRKVIDKTDIALLVCCDTQLTEEIRWMRLLEEKNIPVVVILNKADITENAEAVARQIQELCGRYPVIASATENIGIDGIISAIKDNRPCEDERTIVGNLITEGGLVLLVMPQDIQAPKGRLILPQVQTLRELLDKKCMVVSCTTDKLDEALQSLSRSPDLIITDSQVFNIVSSKKPAESKLTSFSVLFARQKGDIDYYVESASVIARLDEKTSRVLITEACTHAPLSEDIGRVKLPALLRKRVGGGLRIDVVSGTDFPDDLTPYALVIQCGSCMFNRKHVMSRIEKAKKQHVPMTNYGIAIAFLNDILDKIEY